MAVGPVINIRKGSGGSFQLPDYSPIARGLAGLGAGVAGGLDTLRQQREEEQRKRDLAAILAAGRTGYGTRPAPTPARQAPHPGLAPVDTGYIGPGQQAALAAAFERGITEPAVMQAIGMMGKPAGPKPTKLRTLYNLDTGEQRAVPEASQAAYELAQQGWTTEKPDKLPGSVGEYEAAKKAGLIPEGMGLQEYLSWKRAQTVVTATTNVDARPPLKVPPGYMLTEDERGVVPIPGGPADQLSDAQGKAALFADRIKQTEDVLSALDDAGNPLDMQGTRVGGAVASVLPGGNVLQTPEYQRYEQAKRNFINAVLRRESGAVIADSEFDNADKQYFPQVGDSAEVIEQKRQNRLDAYRGMVRDAGPRYREEIAGEREVSVPAAPEQVPTTAAPAAAPEPVAEPEAAAPAPSPDYASMSDEGLRQLAESIFASPEEMERHSPAQLRALAAALRARSL